MEAGEFGYFGLPQEPGEELPWQYPRAQRMVGVSRTGQSWLSWMSGADFPLAIKEKQRRGMEAANVEGRRRLTKKGELATPLGKRQRLTPETRTLSRDARDEPPTGPLGEVTPQVRGSLSFSTEDQELIATQQSLEASAAAPEEIPSVDIGPVKAEPALSPLVVVFIALLVILCLMWV